MNASIFPPDSAIWRISREHVLLLGGPAAAILQIAHPEVALGVAAHSDFRNDSLGRLLRTLEAVYTVTFAPRAQVEAMAERVRRSHARVRGWEPRRYSAFSPGAQMWVLATLIALSVELYGRYVGRLDSPARESYFHDMRIFGTFFGLPARHGPQTWNDFEIYYRDMLADPRLGSSPVCRELARHVAYPARPAILRPLWPLSGLAARNFLPPPIAEKLDLDPRPFDRAAGRLLDRAIPAILPLLPRRIRFAPQYLAALKRLPARA